MTKPIKRRKDQDAERVRALVKETDLEKPTRQERAALMEALKKDEALWRKTSDMNSMAQRLLLNKFPAETGEAIRIRLETMQHDLGYAESPGGCSPLRRGRVGREKAIERALANEL